MKSKLVLSAALGLALASPAPAALFSTNWSSGFVNGTIIPDGNLSGWSDTRTLAGLDGTIGDISVTLSLANGWNGDLYAYLTHGSGFTVLLNRVGTPGLTYGYADTGFAITLSDAGTPGLHNYQSGPYSLNGNGQLTGTWQPDGVGFAAGGFVGLDPNGTWTLFIVDYETEGVTLVSSWGLDMTLVPIPEVETWIAAALAGLFGACWVNRQVWRGVKPNSGGESKA